MELKLDFTTEASAYFILFTGKNVFDDSIILLIDFFFKSRQQ